MSAPAIKPISPEDRRLWEQHNIETLREWRAIPFTQKIQMVEEMERLAVALNARKSSSSSSAASNTEERTTL